MEYDWVKEKFHTFKNLSDVPNLDSYKAFNITGGEPLMCPTTAWKMAKHLKEAYNKPVYIYTNGVHLYGNTAKTFVGFVDGFNVGIHDNFDKVMTNIFEANEHVPVRVAIWEKELTPMIKNTLEAMKIEYKTWKMDDCDVSYKEDWIKVESL